MGLENFRNMIELNLFRLDWECWVYGTKPTEINWERWVYAAQTSDIGLGTVG